jgi:chorismate dehydratase
VIPRIQSPNFIPGYGIAARGRVDSVLLLSQVPIGKIREIVLDLESRTSVQLVRILATELWNIDPIWRDETEVAPEFSQAELESIVAIGDRALRLAKSYSFCYDLSVAWSSLTGLPFVFAAWVSPNPIPSSVTNTLQRVFETVNNPDEQFLAQLQDIHPETNVREYLRNRIVYNLGEPELAGMRCFLQKLGSSDSKTILSIAK